jgi:heme/copper-type cytochrome/quinol oxidase subunit 1
MKNIIQKPHIFISLTMLIILIGSFFNAVAFDIPLHDTYLVINSFHIAIIATLIVGLFALIYRIGFQYGFQYLTVLTLLQGISLLLTLSFLLFPDLYFQSMPNRYYSFDTFDAFKDHSILQNWAHKLFTISLIGFFLFFILNMIFGFFKRNKI